MVFAYVCRMSELVSEIPLQEPVVYRERGSDSDLDSKWDRVSSFVKIARSLVVCYFGCRLWSIYALAQART